MSVFNPTVYGNYDCCFINSNFTLKIMKGMKKRIIAECESIQLFEEDLKYATEIEDFDLKLSIFIEKVVCVCDSNINFLKSATLNLSSGVNNFDLFGAVKLYNYDLVEEYLDYQFKEFFYDDELANMSQIDLSLIIDLDVLADLLVCAFNSELNSYNYSANLH